MGRFADMLDALTAAVRASPAPAVPPYETETGHAQEEFAPTEYQNYIATSNDVYSAAMLRARSLAKLGLVYFDAPDGMGETVEGGGEVGELLRHVNPHWTWRRMIVQYELSMAIWGQSYWVVERGANLSTPNELWWVKPTNMRPILDREDYIEAFRYQVPGSGETIRFDPGEVVWFRYPNIIDEFTGLAPMAAVRLAADVASSSLKANQKLFDQGLINAGIVGPPKEQDFTPEQAVDLEKSINDRFQGKNRAHKWGVFRYDFQAKEIGVSPKDAMFIEQMNLTFRQVCRGMGVPPALLADSEYATLANVDAYDKQLWTGLMEFEANFMADEINEQLIPMFSARGAGGVQSIKFDFSKVAVLQEDATEAEARHAAQIADGRKTINEWREEHGYDRVEWGDVYWASWNLVPVESSEIAPGGKEPEAAEVEATQAARNLRDTLIRSEEQQLVDELRGVFARIFDAAQRKLRQGTRDAEAAANDPFDKKRYVVILRQAARGPLGKIVSKVVALAAGQAGVDDYQDLLADPAFVKQAETLVQEMADRVASQVHRDLRDTIAAGIDRNETIDQMTDRVRKVVGPDAAEYRARRIAQTESTRAVTDNQIETWERLGVKEKRWVTQGDNLVRDTHQAVAGTVVGLHEDFQVGAGSGPGPGRTGVIGEDVNCRCFLEPVKTRSIQVPLSGNGHAMTDQLTIIRDALMEVRL